MDRILLVDDEHALRDVVSKTLRSEGYAVVESSSGRDALDRATRDAYGVIVLDLGLPDMDGLEVCRTLRSRSVTTPILIVTARGEIASRVAGLESGADDFMLKPFDRSELLARIRALLRRAAAAAPPRPELDRDRAVHVGDIELRPARRQVQVGERGLAVTGREFDILQALAGAEGCIVARQELLDAAWQVDGHEPSSNVLDVLVGRIRRKLRDSGSRTTILTVRGLGFRICDGHDVADA